jgi:hypothetical protein
MEAIRKFVCIRKSQKNFLSGFLISQNKKQLKTPLLFLILFWCFSLNANAQTPTDVTLSVNAVTGLLYVALPDSNISEIELQIGTKPGLSDVFSHTFTFDQTTGLPSGMTYSRNGLNTYLGLGAITPNTVYDSKVRLKSTSGTWGDWYEIISN